MISIFFFLPFLVLIFHVFQKFKKFKFQLKLKNIQVFQKSVVFKLKYKQFYFDQVKVSYKI